jgi:hypothetical protein
MAVEISSWDPRTILQVKVNTHVKESIELLAHVKFHVAVRLNKIHLNKTILSP